MYDDYYKYKEKKRSVRIKKSASKANCNYEKQDEERPKYSTCSQSRRQPVPINHFNETQIILLKIQPTIEVRERYLNPHINCVQEELGELCPNELKEKPYLLTLSNSKSKPFISSIPKKLPTNLKIQDNDIKDRQKRKEHEKRTEKTEDKQQSAVFESAQEDQGRENDNGDRKKKSKHQKKRKKKPQFNQYMTDEDSDSEIPICSDDSEIYFADLSLTREEKNRIEENRQRVHPASDNKKTKPGNTTEDISDVEGLNKENEGTEEVAKDE